MTRNISSMILAVLICSAILPARAEKSDNRVYNTKRIDQSALIIDGCMDESAWESVEWEDEFIQHEPYEGKKPSQLTAFKILYDNKNIYIGIRAYDTEADKIDARLSRRDQIDGDLVAVQIDSYFDHRTAFTFMVNAGGGKMDGIYTNDGENEDWTPDPVWYTKTLIDDKGWTAEMQIPLSQLRFSRKEKQVWGLQVGRLLYRKEELSLWQHIPRNSPGWVHMFGELRGISGLKSSRRIEILPYVVGKAESMEKEAGNPFVTGHRQDFNIGLDGKIGLTNDLTVDFTINPDFGQVEADPSVVNLTAYETFYEEKRPFFIEGKNIFNYQLMLGDGDLANNNLFYSRRIGRYPSYSPDIEDDENINMPKNSTILGAVKLTGKTKSGLSIGVLDAVTQIEKAEIDINGKRRFEAVEPFANYFIGRIQKDFNEGSTTIGGIVTNTYRDIRDEHLEELNKNAFTGGFDFSHSWKERTWFISGKSVFSYISGREEAMIRQQRSSRRYFQRPDADYVELDSSLTSLSGYGGSLFFGRQGNSHVNFGIGGNWQSPGLELNDMGFLRDADMILQFTWMGLRWWEPFSIFRNMNVNLNQWSVWNFGKKNLMNGGNINVNAQFKNYWGAGFGFNFSTQTFSTSTLRGGPGIYLPSSSRQWFNINTNQRKPLRFNLNGSHGSRNDGFSSNYSIRTGVTVRQGDKFSLTMNPFYAVDKSDLQYIDTFDFKNDTRYILGRISQKTAGIVLRFDINITPDLTVQFYGQPFVSAGRYSHLRYVTSPRADKYIDRFHYFTGTEIEYHADTDAYYIDENSDANIDYSIENSDFNFRQFRSNLIVRWEYLSGSTLYLVWSQGRTDLAEDGTFSFRNDMRDLFHVYPHDVILLKMNFWLSL